MSFSTLISAYPKLRSQEVAIWIFETNGLLEYRCKLEPMLSNEELYRSRAFYFKADSERYICSHGMLRLILAYYTNIKPVSLAFICNSYGKPRIANQEYIKFNLSHTNDLIAIAITMNREIGVDIEKCISLSNIDNLSRSIMHDDELFEYFSLPEFKKNDYFYRCWVKKESIVKAWGTGLREDIRKIKVMNNSYYHIYPMGSIDKNESKKEWCIKNLDPPSRHYGAVCFEGSHANIKIIYKNDITLQRMLKT